MAVYTLGIWTVRPGHEDEFVQAWQEFAAATATDHPGARATLLQDRDVPNRFISSGPWESLEQIAAWRASATFADGLARIRGSLEGFEAHTLDEAASVG